MFILDPTSFRIVDLDQLPQFVECWNRYYGYDESEYFAALNVGSDLTEENVIRLLRWKDPRMLTHPKTSGGPNPRVTRVLEQRDSLNAFRSGGMTATEFQEVTSTIYPNGIVWQLFLFHICRPAEWPIADQHVFRAFSVMFGFSVPTTIDEFEQYRTKFAELAGRLRGTTSSDVETNKQLDNALFAFGQFLAAYDV